MRKLAKKFSSALFSKESSFGTVSYEQTHLADVIAVMFLLVGNMGNAWCLLNEIAKSMPLDVSSIAFASPVLSHIWLNVVLTLIGAVLICGRFRIKHGASGRSELYENVKWRKDKQKKASDERKLYEVYRKAYRSLDRFAKLSSEAAAPGAWERMNIQLLGVYDMLSLHANPHVRTLPLSKEVEHFLGDGKFDEYVVSPVEAFAAELSDLVQIWSSSYGFNGMKVVLGGHGDEERLEHIARSLGIDSLVDAYYSGVPLEDVLA